MVTVKSVAQRIGKDGKSFMTLELSGDIELVQSQNTGRFYATVRRCSISSTFDEQTANQFIGKQLPGNIIRTETDPYDFTVPETGESITLSHAWSYQPEERKHVAKAAIIPQANKRPEDASMEELLDQIQ